MSHKLYAKGSLEARQAEMRRKWRPSKRRRLTVAERECLRKRIAATVLLRKGWPIKQVAELIGVHPDAVVRWKERGCPLLD